MVAAPAMVPLVEVSLALAQLVEEVVNCAAVFTLVSLAQVVLTRQSYKVAAVKPLTLTDVEVVPDAALIQVELELAL